MRRFALGGAAVAMQALCCAATAVLSQPQVQLRLPARTPVDGEPVFVEVRITNAGQEPLDLAPPWVWNDRAVKEQKLPLPLRLEAMRDGSWTEVCPAVWRRSLGMLYQFWEPVSAPWPIVVRLWPGETSESWLDLTWQFELPAGEYRVQWRGPVFGRAQSGGEFWLADPYAPTTAEAPVHFRMREALGADAVVLALSNYRPGTRTPEGGDRSDWLLRVARVAPERLSGTSYSKWPEYLSVRDELGGGGLGGAWQRLSPRTWELVTRWSGQPSALRQHPMRDRLGNFAAVMTLLWEAKRDPAAWPASRDRIQALLAQSNDHEWVGGLVRFAAWGDHPQLNQEDYASADAYEAALAQQKRTVWETPAGWGYPWFRLPPDQRPGGVAAKQEP